MAMHRQVSAVLVVCQIKRLLKELGIKDTDKEVKARIVVWYQSETIFYMMSVYFMTAGINKSRYTLAGALIATFAGLAASFLLA